MYSILLDGHVKTSRRKQAQARRIAYDLAEKSVYGTRYQYTVKSHDPLTIVVHDALRDHHTITVILTR